MRRRKIKDTESIKPIIEQITQFIPNDIEELQSDLDDLKKSITHLNKMKHKDYINSRKSLMNIITKSKELRANLLETYKLFTEEI